MNVVIVILIKLQTCVFSETFLPARKELYEINLPDCMSRVDLTPFHETPPKHNPNPKPQSEHEFKT